MSKREITMTNTNNYNNYVYEMKLHTAQEKSPTTLIFSITHIGNNLIIVPIEAFDLGYSSMFDSDAVKHGIFKYSTCDNEKDDFDKFPFIKIRDNLDLMTDIIKQIIKKPILETESKNIKIRYIDGKGYLNDFCEVTYKWYYGQCVVFYDNLPIKLI